MNRNLVSKKQYPVDGMMPKQESQAASFLEKFSEYDGRDTVVAILDGGIDPGAKGMQITTTGQPKIIDIVDCTGIGDVVMKKVVKATVVKDSTGAEIKVLQGLTGRTLIIDPSWSCPSGEYRVGVKSAYELFPEDLAERVEPICREVTQSKSRQLLYKTEKMLGDFDKKNPSPSKDASLQRGDLEAQIEALKELEELYTDPGSIYDCIVFHDGSNWRAVIDVNESGDLRGQPCLTDYRKELQYHSFGKLYDLNFSVNIYEEGDILSIVTVCGSHGTHVAGITAANFPDNPALNGIAPGAQLVSLRTLIYRIGTIATGPSLTRAASYLATHNIDLCNISSGQSSSLPTGGHFVNLMAEEVISKSGCTFFTAAGNDGPCLSTIVGPAGMHESFITVGSFVHHPQMEAGYTLLDSVPERPYTWSSTGPCTDGYSGVDIYAPGSAISSMPTYKLVGLMQKEGTSMASPNACGSAALLISGLKAEKIKYTPFRLKTAIVQSAKDVGDPLGVGFFQVEDAWNYLIAHKERGDLDIQFSVRVKKREMCRGIYLRELEETSFIQTPVVYVTPTFPAERDLENPQYNDAKRVCDIRVTLKSTQPWITAPNFVRLDSSGNNFGVKVDPTKLEAGQFHFGEIIGYDSADVLTSSAISRGPLFRVPVCVAKPALTCNGSIDFKDIKYSPGHIGRYFVQVPEGASYCELILHFKSHANTGPTKFRVHTLQIVPQRDQKERFMKTYNLGKGTLADPTSGGEVLKKFLSVRGGLNMEFCIAQFWSALGEHTISFSLEFQGVQIAGNLANGSGVVHLNPEITRLEVIAPVRRNDDVHVRVSFDNLRKYLRPTKAEISPMHSERNTLPNNKLLYCLVLSYNFSVKDMSSITVNFPMLREGRFGHFMASVSGILYDTNDKVVDDIQDYPDTLHLDGGYDYTFKLHLITEETEVLEKLKTTICEMDFDINKVYFETYKTMRDVFCSKWETFRNPELERNDLTVFHVTASPELPMEAQSGDALIGSLSFTNKKIEGAQHGMQYDVIYAVPPPPAEDKKPKVICKADDEEIHKSLKDTIVKLQIDYLKKLSSSSSEYKSVYKSLDSGSVENSAFLLYKIETMWQATTGQDPSECLLNQSLNDAQAQEIISLSESIVKMRDQSEDLVALALKNKLMALAATGQPLPTDFEETFETLQRISLDEPDEDLEFLLLSVQRERKATPPRFGSALKSVQVYLKNTSLTKNTARGVKMAWRVRSQLYLNLDWDVWVKYDAVRSVLDQPLNGKSPY